MYKIVKYCLVFMLSILLTCSGFATGENIKSKTHDKKLHYYQKQIQQYWYISPDTSVLLADSAIALAEHKNSKRDIAYFNLLKGVAYYYQGKNSEAVSVFKKSLEYGKNSLGDKLTANTYNMLSLVYRNLGIFDSAISYSNKALFLRLEKIKDSNDIAGSYDNLSTIYHKLGDYNNAIKYSLKAADIFEKTGNQVELAYSWSNLSDLYSSIGDKKHTYQFLTKALEVIKKGGSEADYADILENMGGYYLDYGSLDSAMIYFKRASALYKKLERYDGYADSKSAMGEIYLKWGKNKEAEESFTEAYRQFNNSKRLVDLTKTEVLLAEVELRKENYSKARQYIDSAYLHEKLINSDKIRLKIMQEDEKLMEKLGKDTAALALFHRIVKLKDRIDKNELDSKLEELSAKYHSEKINAENRKLKQQQVIEKMKAKQMRLVNFIIIVSAILIVVILLLILQKRKRDILLQNKNLDILKKEDALIKSELENAELKKQKLLKENKFNAKQLTTYTLHMMQKNLILRDILEDIKEMENKDARQIKKELVNLKIQLINALSSDTDWENFKLFFEKVNANFFVRLKDKYPNISKKDEKLCALIRLNMNINESASVLNVDSNTVRIARYRLRKKMNLSTDDDLYDVIDSI